MKVAFVTHYDARDRRFYAGTSFYMSSALAGLDEVDLHYVGPLQERGLVRSKLTKLFYVAVKRQDYHRNLMPHILEGYAEQVAAELERLQPDVIITPTSLPIAYLDTHLPIVLWGDATYAGLEGFYPGFKNLGDRTRREGHQMEQGALDRYDYGLTSSCDYEKQRTCTYTPGQGLSCGSTIDLALKENNQLEVAGSLEDVEVPEEFNLQQNYPNPFNPETRIQFALPEASTVRLVVYDMMGRVVSRLVDRTLDAGVHEVVWDAAAFPSGVYYYTIDAENYRASRTMTLLK